MAILYPYKLHAHTERPKERYKTRGEYLGTIQTPREHAARAAMIHHTTPTQHDDCVCSACVYIVGACDAVLLSVGFCVIYLISCTSARVQHSRTQTTSSSSTSHTHTHTREYARTNAHADQDPETGLVRATNSSAHAFYVRPFERASARTKGRGRSEHTRRACVSTYHVHTGFGALRCVQALCGDSSQQRSTRELCLCCACAAGCRRWCLAADGARKRSSRRNTECVSGGGMMVCGVWDVRTRHGVCVMTLLNAWQSDYPIFY